MDEMEQLLILWIEDMQMRGDPVSGEHICMKARKIFEELMKDYPGEEEAEDSEPEPFDEADEEEGNQGKKPKGFAASHGWFHRFVKRTGIKNVKMAGEAGSANQPDADKFKETFQEIMDEGGYTANQVFNADETGLFWKKMSSRSYITQEQNKLPGKKIMKDRLTLLLCGNATGLCKIKPLLVYKSETPRAFGKNFDKSTLLVFWRSNKKAWVTRVVFKDWLNEVFAPEVKAFFSENNIEEKALLLLDNAPGHPPGDSLLPGNSWIRIEFLPPNTTSILQPMDQLVIANFKKLYTKLLFDLLFERCQLELDSMSVTKFWRESFNIKECIVLITKAWKKVTQKTLNTAWRPLYPAACQSAPGAGEEDKDEDAIFADIVTTARNLNMEVDANDLTALVQENTDDLSVEDLRELAAELAEATGETAEEEEPIKSADIKNLFIHWDKVQKFLMAHHPKKFEVEQALDHVEAVGVKHFRAMLKAREKQTTSDKFFTAGPSAAAGPSGTAQKRAAAIDLADDSD
ncbi:tigger transposable element-derived protein 1-like [Hydra vulgaris]|uniref:Tigger transposable element-derived protein 1-like n=1 Tax=Hydra vulgaris TaxID=6087 RepID=A0ABM4DGE5_HYDVU